MIIDFHTHIFPKEIRNNREKYFSSEPAFSMLYSRPKSPLAGASDLIKTMDNQGIDLSVTFGFPWQNPYLFKKHNDYIMEAVLKYPDRIKGFCCFDLFSKDIVSETTRCFNGGLSGIGELAFYKSGLDDEAIKKLQPVMEICEKKNSPVLIHTNEPIGHEYPGKTSNTLGQIYRLVKKYKKNKIILAHWGGGLFFYNLLKKEVKQSLKNVFFDTAASPFLYEPEIYKAGIQIAGQNKILFGSDFPLLKPERYFKEIDQAGLTKNEIDSICGTNATPILNL